MSAGFYRDLPVRGDFTRMADHALHASVPGDWLVIITDVQGSTKAIEEGRYKEVNLAGAASIMAMLNAACDVTIRILSLAGGAPVTRERLRLTFSLKCLGGESRLRGGAGASRYLRRIFLLQFVGWLCFRFGLKLGSFDGARYPGEVAENADIRKFDEMLRMILDLSPVARADGGYALAAKAMKAKPSMAAP